MEFVEIKPEMFEQLEKLQIAYKKAIGEDAPSQAELDRLKQAIERGDIHFYGCVCENVLVASCSICITYSTFNYERAGLFEDFYIEPSFRHKGIARKLVDFAYKQSGVGSLVVGCADCDVEMYRAIGFGISLGNMMAFGY